MAKSHDDQPDSPRILPPHPEDVRKARQLAKHTQEEAAAIVHSNARRWREWESGVHSMNPAAWELYLLRTQAIIFTEPPMLKPADSAVTKEKTPCSGVVFKL